MHLRRWRSGKVHLGLSLSFLASLIAAGGVIGYVAHKSTVGRSEWVPMRLVSLQVALPTPTPALPTVAPVAPAVAHQKADVAQSASVPPEHTAVLQPPPKPYASPVTNPVHIVAVDSSIIPSTTLATHYASYPPSTCWDSAGAHHKITTGIPIRLFAAMRGVPCGTIVTIHGPIGTIQVTVWDHGPNCSCPERDLDASEDAFRATVGPLNKGTGMVELQAG